MKLIASGVTCSAAITRSPSFSRSSSSTTTTIRPAAMSSIASSTVAKRISSRAGVLIARCPRASRRTWPRCPPPGSRCGPGSAAPRVVRSSVSGISDTSKPCVVDARDGQRDAVDGDRALLDDVAQQLRRGAAIVTTRAKPSSRTAATVPIAVDVALHDVAARGARRRAARARGSPAARAQLAERRAPQRLVHRVGGEAPSSICVAVRQTPLTATESPSAISRGERRAQHEPRAVAPSPRSPRRCRGPGRDR